MVGPLYDPDYQRKVMKDIVILPSTIPKAGFGAFWMGKTSLPKKTVIGVYAGRIKTREPKDTTYTLRLDSRTYIDSAREQDGNWTRYMNDKKGADNVYFTTDGYVRTKRSILPGEELFVDYGEGYWDGR